MTQRDEAETLANYLQDFEASHTPDGYPAVQQKHLSQAAALLRQQAAEIERLKSVIEGYKADQIEGIEISVKQQAEIERLKAACIKEFESVEKLDADCQRKDALLREALELLEETPEIEYAMEDKLIANIKTELGE